MVKEWFIADTHFGHYKVLEYENRPFSSIEEMDEALIRNWNNVVGRTDKVYMLGDFSFHNTDTTKRILSQLKGYKILIKGNHDKKSTQHWVEAGFDEFSKHPILLPSRKLILSHEPIAEDLIADEVMNVHGHIHLNYDYYLTNYNQEKYKCVSVEQIDYVPAEV
jgi:calcineurin-like phosphoesterase family protein